MFRILILLFIFSFIPHESLHAQAFIKTIDLFHRMDDDNRPDRLKINQDPGIDSLISRYIINNRKFVNIDGSQGMEGFRIQIYYNSSRTAREESAKARAEFINKFPDIISYTKSEAPGYFMVRAGDYKTKIDGFKDLLIIRKEFPNAYLVPDVINFTDLNNK
jgi:hypothetical protein